MYGYVYMTINLINGKRYIGQHQASKFEPDKYIGSGNYFRRAVRKYGKDNFDCKLLEECNSQEELDNCEEKWIKLYDAVSSDAFYNIDAGGKGAKKTSLHRQHLSDAWTEERKLILSARVSGENNPSKRLDVRKKISENNSSRRPENRKKLSEAKKGKPLPHTVEWNTNISKALKGRQIMVFTDEVRAKLSKASSGKNNPMYGKSATKGTKWYNNGVINVRTVECPEGFIPGVLKNKVVV